MASPTSIMMVLIISVVMVSNITAHKNKESTVLFGIKTPYSQIENDDVSIIKPGPQCTVKHVNMIHRHGHRFPSRNYIKNFNELAKIMKQDDFSLPWDPPLDAEHKNHLTNAGVQELYQLGLRLKKRLPEIFQRQYNARLYKFISTNKVRTTHSSTSLAAGLFDGNGSIDKRIQPIALETSPDDDKVLRFYDACVRYKRELLEENMNTEYKTFVNGPEMKRISGKVSRKLGFPHFEISYKNLDAVYIGCAYAVELFGGDIKSGLCSLLDEEDRAILEYAGDIESFYTASNPQNPLSYKISCPLLDDMMKTLRAAAENRSGYVGIFRSSHSSAILMLYTLLGLNKQATPLKHNNFADQINREFRCSAISPFSANVYFVLYDCSGRMKIQLYWNERLKKIPCCHSKVDCDFDTFVKCYEDAVEGCEETFDELCDEKEEYRITRNHSTNSMKSTTLTTIKNENQSVMLNTLLVSFCSVMMAVFKKYFLEYAWKYIYSRKEQ